MTGGEAAPMILWRRRAETFAFAALALGSTSLASAQSTNALPDLTTSEAAFDPYRVAGLPDAAKAAVAQAKAKMRSGELLGFVFAASPDQKNWTLNTAPKAMADYVPSERDGRRSRCANSRLGSLAQFSPSTASRRYRAWRARRRSRRRCSAGRAISTRPSCRSSPNSTRKQAAAYQKAQGPRAFALTTSGLWLWRGGANIVQAIDKTMADCAAEFKPAACLLYAVNGRVVFEAR